MPPEKVRCGWSQGDPLYIEYHDTEWGIPVHDDRRLFEFLILEGAQAGLSWITILRKRENYCEAFDGFDPAQVARYDAKRLARLLENPGIVRNRLKLESAVKNARAFLVVQKEHGSFERYLFLVAPQTTALRDPAGGILVSVDMVVDPAQPVGERYDTAAALELMGGIASDLAAAAEPGGPPGPAAG